MKTNTMIRSTVYSMIPREQRKENRDYAAVSHPVSDVLYCPPSLYGYHTFSKLSPLLSAYISLRICPSMKDAAAD